MRFLSCESAALMRISIERLTQRRCGVAASAIAALDEARAADAALTRRLLRAT
jgi:hypothetical protein